MREILFRGKSKDDGEWVFGYYFYHRKSLTDNEAHYLVCRLLLEKKKIEVDPSTVGQYTGLNDKNGKKIFEGDIVKWDAEEWGGPYNEVVNWDYELLDSRENDWHEWCRVIGNIHSNPDLWKELPEREALK